MEDKSKGIRFDYSQPLELFIESCSRRSLEDIGRKHILGFMSFLKTKGNGPRTIANRVGYLKGFARLVGIEWPLAASDKPRYTEKLVSAYSVAEISALLTVANTEESELLQFFLFTGAREQEVQYATWRDLDLGAKMFQVAEKLDLRRLRSGRGCRVKTANDRRLSHITAPPPPCTAAANGLRRSCAGCSAL